MCQVLSKGLHDESVGLCTNFHKCATVRRVERSAFDPPLDWGICTAVAALQAGHVETFESCEGGSGHAYPEPTVRFHGDTSEGYRALAVAMRAGLAVKELRRVWPINEGEPTGPWWELTFNPTMADESLTR